MNQQALLFLKGREGRQGCSLPEMDVPVQALETLIPDSRIRIEDPGLPAVSELEVVRHFIKLSHRNFSIDTNFYPLGSCTMKYNPKVTEDVARLPGFIKPHPYQPEVLTQGFLELMYRLEQLLCTICGMDGFSLQPAAGAHGELLGMLVIRAYHETRGESRKTVIIPDSAHGTNPSSAHIAGYRVVTIPSDKEAEIDLAALKRIINTDVAALMVTNPNTLGFFESRITEIAEVVHHYGGLLYYDGANLNPLLGMCRPGDMGFDVVHINLHKTFSTPHGGGGPGAGPVGVSRSLVPHLPVPRIEKKGNRYILGYEGEKSVGRIKAFYGNAGVLVKAYAYIRALGEEGLKRVAEFSVVNANYLMQRLKEEYDLPYQKPCMHEFVISGKSKRPLGVRTLDIAKRLIDYGIHPPTIYFPLIVEEALMIEPTESEDKETLDRFVDTMKRISEECSSNSSLLKEAPCRAPVRRLDEVEAARHPDLRWKKPR